MYRNYLNLDLNDFPFICQQDVLAACSARPDATPVLPQLLADLVDDEPVLQSVNPTSVQSEDELPPLVFPVIGTSISHTHLYLPSHDNYLALGEKRVDFGDVYAILNAEAKNNGLNLTHTDRSVTISIRISFSTPEDPDTIIPFTDQHIDTSLIDPWVFEDKQLSIWDGLYATTEGMTLECVVPVGVNIVDAPWEDFAIYYPLFNIPLLYHFDLLILGRTFRLYDAKQNVPQMFTPFNDDYGQSSWITVPQNSTEAYTVRINSDIYLPGDNGQQPAMTMQSEQTHSNPPKRWDEGFKSKNKTHKKQKQQKHNTKNRQHKNKQYKKTLKFATQAATAATSAPYFTTLTPLQFPFDTQSNGYIYTTTTFVQTQEFSATYPLGTFALYLTLDELQSNEQVLATTTCGWTVVYLDSNGDYSSRVEPADINYLAQPFNNPTAYTHIVPRYSIYLPEFKTGTFNTTTDMTIVGFELECTITQLTDPVTVFTGYDLHWWSYHVLQGTILTTHKNAQPNTSNIFWIEEGSAGKVDFDNVFVPIAPNFNYDSHPSIQLLFFGKLLLTNDVEKELLHMINRAVYALNTTQQYYSTFESFDAAYQFVLVGLTYDYSAEPQTKRYLVNRELTGQSSSPAPFMTAAATHDLSMTRVKIVFYHKATSDLTNSYFNMTAMDEFVSFLYPGSSNQPLGIEESVAINNNIHNNKRTKNNNQNIHQKINHVQSSQNNNNNNQLKTSKHGKPFSTTATVFDPPEIYFAELYHRFFTSLHHDIEELRSFTSPTSAYWRRVVFPGMDALNVDGWNPATINPFKGVWLKPESDDQIIQSNEISMFGDYSCFKAPLDNTTTRTAQCGAARSEGYIYTCPIDCPIIDDKDQDDNYLPFSQQQTNNHLHPIPTSLRCTSSLDCPSIWMLIGGAEYTVRSVCDQTHKVCSLMRSLAIDHTPLDTINRMRVAAPAHNISHHPLYTIAYPFGIETFFNYTQEYQEQVKLHATLFDGGFTCPATSLHQGISCSEAPSITSIRLVSTSYVTKGNYFFFNVYQGNTIPTLTFDWVYTGKRDNAFTVELIYWQYDNDANRQEVISQYYLTTVRATDNHVVVTLPQQLPAAGGRSNIYVDVVFAMKGYIYTLTPPPIEDYQSPPDNFYLLNTNNIPPGVLDEYQWRVSLQDLVQQAIPPEQQKQIVVLGSCQQLNNTVVVDATTTLTDLTQDRCVSGTCNTLTGICSCTDDKFTPFDFCTTSKCTSLLGCSDIGTTDCDFTFTQSQGQGNNNNSNQTTPQKACICANDFTGEKCQQKIFANDDAQGGGGSGGATCPAKSIKCANQGFTTSCTDTKCMCNPDLGFTGNTCMTCRLQCQAGGLPSPYSCLECRCPQYYSGRYCQCHTKMGSLVLQLNYNDIYEDESGAFAWLTLIEKYFLPSINDTTLENDKYIIEQNINIQAWLQHNTFFLEQYIYQRQEEEENRQQQQSMASPSQTSQNTNLNIQDDADMIREYLNKAKQFQKRLVDAFTTDLGFALKRDDTEDQEQVVLTGLKLLATESDDSDGETSFSVLSTMFSNLFKNNNNIQQLNDNSKKNFHLIISYVVLVGCDGNDDNIFDGYYNQWSTSLTQLGDDNSVYSQTLRTLQDELKGRPPAVLDVTPLTDYKCIIDERDGLCKAPDVYKDSPYEDNTASYIISFTTSTSIISCVMILISMFYI